jgi:hypothetical protein
MNPLKVKKIASGVALLGIAMGSAALTLGRTSDVAWVGKPLDVHIQVQSDSVDDLLPGCIAAEVHYGETQLDPARVSVSASPQTGAGQSMRVQTTVSVDEPVVTVQLRVGCQQKLSKRYTLFAELLTNVVEPVDRSAPLSDTSKSLVTPVDVTDKPVQPSLVVKNGSARVAVKPLAPKAAKTAMAAPIAKRASKKLVGPRLKLESLDLLIERDPVLRASGELLTLPQEDGAKRAEAAALWRSLNVSPQQLLQDDARALALEKDIKSLHAVTAQNQKGLIDLKGRVEQTESERYANGLVYSLVVLLMASLAAVLWLWWRHRTQRAPDWLHGHEEQDSLFTEIAQDSQIQAPASFSGVQTSDGDSDGGSGSSLRESTDVAPMTGEAASPDAVDLYLEFDPHPAAQRGNTSAPVRTQATRDFSNSQSQSLRSPDSQEVMDVCEQAQFFVSIGRPDKAIDLLTARVAQSGGSSPLVCLELLKLYHALGREEDFEFMRTEFNHWFAAHVPEFLVFGDDGRALDQYPQVMERISALWPTPAVLEYIEGCLYHHAGEGDGAIFDLQAYLDLLFLHSVAKRVVRQKPTVRGASQAEALRIPARANPDDEFPLGDGPAVLHRAGAHNRGAGFGAMKYPPTAPPLESVVDLAVHAHSKTDPSVTDFNFLRLG